ncbi:hypothetical protein [Cohnella mopanensis]|uniref:hypothetical protein n=1 Tax=Cohnella mopanensis TaxID=2911966 RepID=UPI001EF9761A|nr:hypothetical protein [Cohnella mopanensis]
MVKVREAQFRRVLDRGGERFAEVEVFTDHQRDSQMLAYFRAGRNDSYPLVRLITNDADYGVDWFDNSFHSAFTDVMKPLLSSPDHLGEIDRDEFAVQILGYSGVSEALERNLKI